MLGRAILRQILGSYLVMLPEQLEFNYGPQGKPELRPDSGLRFNLSHSHELALLAVTQQHEIGVDLEQVRPLKNAEQIGARYFSQRESITLQKLQPEQRVAGFFNAWTRKEAYLKAIGSGLSRSLNEIEVTLSPTESASFLSNQPELKGWSLFSFIPQPGYIAALAVEISDYELYFYRWR